ncbi:DME family drug/metabolite transporter [Lachnospiraceae bacterium PFB1-21]
MKKVAPLFIIAATLLWAATGVVTRYIATTGLTTVEIAALRVVSSAIIFFIILLLFYPDRLKIKVRDLGWFAGIGLGSLFLNNLAYSETVQRASLSMAVILLYTSPFFVTIMARIFFKEKITTRKLFALTLAFIGCLFVVGVSKAGLEEGIVLTILIGMCAGFGFGLYSILGSVLLKRYDSLTVAFYAILFAALGTVGLTKPAAVATTLMASPSKLPLCIIGSFVTVALPYICYSLALKYMEASKASIISSFEVVAASLYGAVLFGERLQLKNILGIVLVLTALILLQLKPKERGNVKEN